MPANRQLTASLEDYLEAIALLIRRDGHAHTKEIAEQLHVKMPSVSAALKQLDEMHFIVYNTHYPVQLTPAGQEIAERVLNRHAVLKKFFAEILCLPAETASETACRLEHIVDEETVRRFVLFSEAIESRSDAKSLQVYLSEAIRYSADHPEQTILVLSSAVPGTSFRFLACGRNLDGAADPLPFETGAILNLESVSLDKSAFRVNVNGTCIEIPLPVAENLWVEKV